MLPWIGAEACIRPFLFKNKPQMKDIAEHNNFNIPHDLKVDEYRQRPVNTINGTAYGSDSTTADSLLLALTKGMPGASFMKPLKRGTTEDQTKYSVLGQRLEKAALSRFLQYPKNEKLYGNDNMDNQSLYQPGLVKIHTSLA